MRYRKWLIVALCLITIAFIIYIFKKQSAFENSISSPDEPKYKIVTTPASDEPEHEILTMPAPDKPKPEILEEMPAPDKP